MSQQDTYRPAEMPQDAVMTPAMEVPDAPPPAAHSGASPAQDPANVPARTRKASLSLERLRNRMRGAVPANAQWIDTSKFPIGQSTAARTQATQAPRAAQATQTAQDHRTLSQGAALSTLLRSATRQYAPAPTLAPQPIPQQPRIRQSAEAMRSPTVTARAQAQPQMRGALRQVVRQAQQPQAHPAVRPVAMPGAETQKS